MSNRIDALLGRIEDTALREQLAAEVGGLRDGRKFGLVFERHLPESVSLPQVKPRRGLQVQLKDSAAGDHKLRVDRVKRGIATCTPLRTDNDSDVGPDTVEHKVSDLMVVAEFGEPVYPGLNEVGRAEGPNTPDDAHSHVVLNAENYHALLTLEWSHEEAVDCIYIDPPYNTGNKTWQYNDSYVGQQDSYKHSKWLSFMERRLLLARKLLKPTGVIIVSIGDDEHHRLRMLMDQVFGAANFVADLVWDGGTKSYANLVSSGQDYMLVYSRSMSTLADNNVQWREAKPGLEEVLAKAGELFELHGQDPDAAGAALRAWMKTAGLSPGIKRFNQIEGETGRVFNADRDLGAPEKRANRSFRPIKHPVTGKDCPVPSNGWRLSDKEMDIRLSAGRIAFGADENKIPREKSYLDEGANQIATAVFQKDRNSASSHVAKILGEKRFPFPKDHEVLMRWVRLVAGKDAVILDFFGGSGSTVEAVMRLNVEDGGNRQAILVTNNELDAKKAAELTKSQHKPGEHEWEKWGIFHRVTKPRIETIVTGVREDGSEYSDGLPQRVGFFELEYLDVERVRDDRAFEAIAPMLWLKAGSRGEILVKEDLAGFAVTEQYGILHSIDAWRRFVDAFPEAATHAFVVTDSQAAFATVAEALPAGVEKIRLYERYLKTFEINTDEGQH